MSSWSATSSSPGLDLARSGSRVRASTSTAWEDIVRTVSSSWRTWNISSRLEKAVAVGSSDRKTGARGCSIEGVPIRVVETPAGLASRVWDRVVETSNIRLTLALAIDVYRVLALGFAGALLVKDFEDLRRPWLGVSALGTMAAWTVLAPVLYRVPAVVPGSLLAADLALSIGLVIGTTAVQSAQVIAAGTATLPSFWVSASVLAWAVFRGPLAGAAAGAALGLADLWVIGSGLSRATVENISQLLILGVVVGWLARLGTAAERAQAEAAAVRAAAGERDRWAAEIHDGVLQVLALVRRRTAGLPGALGELSTLAGDQEAAVRALSAGPPVAPAGGTADLRELLRSQARAHVAVSLPADPVLLDAAVAREVAAAVAAALDNVSQHVGPAAPAWVLVEDRVQEVVVTVRDDGPGVGPGRLADARVAGRLGISASIEGRMRAVGASAVLRAEAGQGTEVELRVPR